MSLVVATRAKQGPNLLSFSRIRYFGACPYGVASRSCCATQGSVGDLVTPTWITFRDLPFDEEERKERSKEEICRLPGQGKAFASMPEPPRLRAQGEFDQSSCMLVVSFAA